MGYDLYITRKADWFEDGSEISDADWSAYLASDPEMRLTGAAEAALPDGSTLRYENPLLAEWSGHSDGEVVWFDFRNGNVVVKNPDEEVITKMQEIASKLQARVQGEEGEFYDP